MTTDELLLALYTDMQEMKSDVQAMKSDMQEMKSEMQEMKSEMQEMKSDMQEMKSEIQELKSEMQEMKSEVQELKSDMQAMKQRITGIELTLENETNRNIKIIAEGHTDLSRKLSLAMKEESEKELLRIRVNILENEMRKIKEHLEIA